MVCSRQRAVWPANLAICILEALKGLLCRPISNFYEVILFNWLCARTGEVTSWTKCLSIGSC